MNYCSGPVIVDSRKYINEEIVRNPYTMALRLTVTDLKDGDFTKYSCTAKNSLGEVVGSIKLYGEFALWRAVFTRKAENNNFEVDK